MSRLAPVAGASDITAMKQSFVPGVVAITMLFGMAMVSAPALAQIFPLPGTPTATPPAPPPPPPPPKIEVPTVPQLGAPPRAVRPATRPDSFGDRMTRCLHEAAAAGLGPKKRAAYSRACANQQ
jgi:hypothetical protein